MKNLIALLLLLSMAACHKENEKKLELFLPGPQVFGSGTAVKEVPGLGEAGWEASGIAQKEAKPNFFDIDLGTENSAGERREDLFISEIPLTSGHYVIQGGGPQNTSDGITGAAYFRLEADGDVSVASYFAMDNSPGNFVEVAVDTIAKTAKGTFSIKFKLDNQDKGQDFPETVIFKNGTFNVRFFE